MRNRLTRERGRLRALPLFGSRVRVARIDETEDTVSLEIVGGERQRLARGLLRLVTTVLPQLERGNLCPHLCRRLVGGRSTHERRQRPCGIAGGFEPPRHQELEIRIGSRLGKGGRRNRCGNQGRDEHRAGGAEGRHGKGF